MRRPLLLLSVSLLTISAPAQNRRPMTFEDMMKMRRLGDIALSPDGKWVLFSATDVDLEKNTRTSHLWIVPATREAMAIWPFRSVRILPLSCLRSTPYRSGGDLSSR